MTGHLWATKGSEGANLKQQQMDGSFFFQKLPGKHETFACRILKDAESKNRRVKNGSWNSRNQRRDTYFGSTKLRQEHEIQIPERQSAEISGGRRERTLRQPKENSQAARPAAVQLRPAAKKLKSFNNRSRIEEAKRETHAARVEKTCYTSICSENHRVITGGTK
jgi:hypothetical protein